MKRALQAILITGKQMKRDVLTGKKKITIRDGHRNYTRGPVLIGCHLLNWVILREIISVQHTYLNKVSRYDLNSDGFLNWTDAEIGLKKYYPNIESESPVTVIKWE